MIKKPQIELFEDLENTYEMEWKGMPEFNMNPEIPILTIKVSFKTEDDMKAFGELIGQKIKFNMENYWFPKLNRVSFSEKKYIDSDAIQS